MGLDQVRLTHSTQPDGTCCGSTSWIQLREGSGTAHLACWPKSTTGLQDMYVLWKDQKPNSIYRKVGQQQTQEEEEDLVNILGKNSNQCNNVFNWVGKKGVREKSPKLTIVEAKTGNDQSIDYCLISRDIQHRDIFVASVRWKRNWLYAERERIKEDTYIAKLGDGQDKTAADRNSYRIERRI